MGYTSSKHDSVFVSSGPNWIRGRLSSQRTNIFFALNGLHHSYSSQSLHLNPFHFGSRLMQMEKVQQLMPMECMVGLGENGLLLGGGHYGCQFQWITDDVAA